MTKNCLVLLVIFKAHKFVKIYPYIKVLSGESETEKVSQSNFVIFDILLDQKAESQNYLPSLVLWLASKNHLKSETIVDEMITLGGDKFASLMSFSSGTKLWCLWFYIKINVKII